MKSKRIRFDGLTANEVLQMPIADVDVLVFNGEAIVLNIGSAQLLGQFSLTSDTMIIELAQIDGGGEGVLPALGALANRLVQQRGVAQIEWLVHAVSCAQPNPKLRNMLIHRGFKVRSIAGTGEVFHQISAVSGENDE